MSIRVLDPDVAAKIAAGEVIERPSSIVKELVENSLDSGATQVIVEVHGGGIELIRITDNGAGILATDVELAFERHATSKVSAISDLDSISTLGFRGEALPSIAAVARVSLVTRTRDADAGREVQLRSGRMVKSGPQGCPTGTAVTVEALFEELPARRKFLKSPSGEAGRISDLVSRFALAFPEVQFRLFMDSRDALNSPGTGRLGDALISVYGGESASSMLELAWDGPGEGYDVRGFVSAPSLHRANRTYFTFLLNRRWIQSPLLSFALTESYQGFLPERRYPIAVLNLVVPLDEVDVNVHPAKREVRFQREDRVFSALQRAVRATLVAVSPVPQIRLPQQPAGPEAGATGLGLFPQVFGSPRPQLATGESSSGQPSATPVEAMSTLRVLGQVKNTYLVTEGPDGLYLLDQHAAHERVLYEKLSGDIADRAPLAQALLEPATVELSPGQEELVQANLELLERYGFRFEPFGERTYLLRALPTIVKDSSPEKALQDVLDLMSFEGLVKEREEALATSIACHSAVRAGMVLTQQEMEQLVRQLESCQAPHTCPHGRPTIVHLSSHHLEREFGRR